MDNTELNKDEMMGHLQAALRTMYLQGRRDVLADLIKSFVSLEDNLPDEEGQIKIVPLDQVIEFLKDTLETEQAPENEDNITIQIVE